MKYNVRMCCPESVETISSPLQSPSLQRRRGLHAQSSLVPRLGSGDHRPGWVAPGVIQVFGVERRIAVPPSSVDQLITEPLGLLLLSTPTKPELVKFGRLA